MKIDIPYYIRQVLREQRKVYIPEVGTFNLSQAPARISENKSIIHPPSLNIEFQDGISEDKSLKRYIQDTDKFSSKKINAAISEYSKLIYDNLINLKVNEIEGIGTLVRNEKVDKIVFEPTLNSFTKEYKDLKSLPIHPLVRIKEDSAIDYAVNTQDQVIRPESKYRWLLPIIAGVMIAALVVLGWKWYNDRDTSLYYNPDEETEVIGNENNNDSVDTFFDEVNTDKELSLDAKYKEVDEMLDGTSESNVADQSNSKLEEELNELVADDNKNDDTISSDSNSTGENENSDEVEETIDPESTTDNSRNKYEDIIPESGNCIIILASLKKASNITRMISLIERDGKEAYTSQYKGKTRVGFTFDCSNVDIDAYLTDIRKRHSSKAWYLDPSVAIPYK